MSFYCDTYCVNKENCSSCNKDNFDKFIPNERVKKYFYKTYIGKGGHNGFVYRFNSNDENLVPTHKIKIYSEFYCPYCGEKMFTIYNQFNTIKGYCCICEGAEAEIEYEKEKAELISKHLKEISDLNMKYVDKLTFCSEKLIERKHSREKEHLKYTAISHSHFGKINGESYSDIAQFIK